MTAATVWFNKNLSSTFNAVEVLRAAANGQPFRVVASHTNSAAPVARVCDAFEVEPPNLREPDYVAYCLDLARRHGVQVFFPGRKLAAIVQARADFKAAGVRLVAAANAETLALLEHKAALYAALGPEIVALPDYAVVNDLAGFDTAYARLRALHDKVCIKPAVSVFGLGFRILSEHGSALHRLLNGDPLRIGLAEARSCLAERPRFRDLLVMEYLPGPERSVDCLAREGKLLRCVVRLKSSQSDGGQLLEDHPAIVEMVRRLTARLRLAGIFNVQFRDRGGVPYLLEINPRMSGGLHYACLSGVAFPYWAVRLALGTATPDDIPQPRTGVRVGQVIQAVLL